LLCQLNERVFFWPGGPDISDYGQRHFERYRAEKPVILRVPTSDLFEANPESVPEFCRFNSGSPRCTKGLGSPRGPSTFIQGTTADFSPGNVVEVTFLESVLLPHSTKVGDSPDGPWRELF
jgi:hypothetical protein